MPPSKKFRVPCEQWQSHWNVKAKYLDERFLGAKLNEKQRRFLFSVGHKLSLMSIWFVFETKTNVSTDEHKERKHNKMVKWNEHRTHRVFDNKIRRGKKWNWILANESREIEPEYFHFGCNHPHFIISHSFRTLFIPDVCSFITYPRASMLILGVSFHSIW